MPAWWLGPDLTVSTPDTLITQAADPAFAAVRSDETPSSARTLSIAPSTSGDDSIALQFDGFPLTRCRNAGSLVFFLESLLTHLATHGNRSHLVLHAGLVRWRNRTLLLPGERGSGKSTTTLWLSHAGGEYLGDDLCFLDTTSGLIRGLAKAATLKRGSFELFKDSTSYPDPLRGEVRYHLPPRVRSFRAPPLQIDHLIFPRYTPGITTRISPVPRPLAALSLIQQTYGGGEWGEHGLKAAARITERTAHLIEYSDLTSFEQAVESLLP